MIKTHAIINCDPLNKLLTNTTLRNYSNSENTGKPLENNSPCPRHTRDVYLDISLKEPKVSLCEKRYKSSARPPCVSMQRCKCVEVHRSGERTPSGP